MAYKFPTTSRRRTAITNALTTTHEENDDGDERGSDDVDKTAGKRLTTTVPQRGRLMTVKKGLLCTRATIQSTILSFFQTGSLLRT
mmetsp:Transcript_43386/g.105157  ORF Transcript_43386/g.105157 Transcript_43386/m.105157 type:complete len:86 (-) Transcript_43386:85-342(-)